MYVSYNTYVPSQDTSHIFYLKTHDPVITVHLMHVLVQGETNLTWAPNLSTQARMKIVGIRPTYIKERATNMK